MKHLEIIGTPGAGKSTLLQHLKTVSGVNGNDQELYSIAYNSLTNATIPINPLQTFCGRLYWKYYLNDSCLDRFTTQFPQVTEIIESAGTIDDRSGYPTIYYTAAAEYMCLRSFSSKRFVLDEGLAQLAGEISGLDLDLGKQFLETIPTPDGVIHVRCSAEECLRRQQQRDKALATSVADLDRSDAIERLEQYDTHFQVATRILTRRGAKVVEVNTETDTPKECFRQVLTEFDELGP